jgi:hypothetical protein
MKHLCERRDMTDLPDNEKLRESVAQVIAEELRNRNISLGLLDDPNKRLPRGLWESIRSILNERGVERPRGGPWTSKTEVTTGYVYSKAHKAAIFSRVRELIGEPSKEQGADTDILTRLADMQVQIDRLNEEVSKLTQDRPVSPDRHDRDEPEFPRPGEVRTERISGDLNIVLWDLLEQERKRLGGTRAKTLNTLLWRAFGRPSLFLEKKRD